MRSFRAYLLGFLVAASGCTAPNLDAARTEHPAASTVPRVAVNQAPGAPPPWLDDPARFQDPSDPALQCFRGSAHRAATVDEAIDAALAEARKEAAAFMGTRVYSEYERVAQRTTESPGVKETEWIRTVTRNTVDALLERSERAGTWWIRYSDGTFDGYARIRIPKENLEPTRMLVRVLFLAAAKETDPARRAALMDGILTLRPGNRLALYVKARAFEALARFGAALSVLEELKQRNQGPRLDLSTLYRGAELEPQEGDPGVLDLDALAFRWTPHWKRALDALDRLAKAREMKAVFSARLNETRFRRSDFHAGEDPVIVRLSCPDREYWYRLFWIDREGIFPANRHAPAPDRVPPLKGLKMGLGTCNGTVRLLFLGSTDRAALEEIEGYDGKPIFREKVEAQKDPKEIDRVERFVRGVKERLDEGGKIHVGMVMFIVEP